MSKIFVIAGTREEATQWIKSNLEKRTLAGETTLSMSEYVYVDDIIRIRGYKDPKGVFIGTWRERSNILEIVETLFLQCEYRNRALEKIVTEVRALKIKPTPKLKPVAGGWINEELAIDHAANLLANSIDDQILKDLINGSNTPT